MHKHNITGCSCNCRWRQEQWVLRALSLCL